MRPSRWTARAVLAALVATAALAPAPVAVAAPVGTAKTEAGAAVAPYDPAVVIVGFEPGTPAAERARVRSLVAARKSEPLSPLAADAELVRLGAGWSVDRAIAALRRNPNVRFVEPDFVVSSQVASNDPDYLSGGLWGMYGDGTTPANAFGSQAGEAWADGHVGSESVYVMVIDEGIQVDHPDLAGNVWTNPFDPVNGIDDDGNGYVDDSHGWDFFNGDRTVYDGTGDDHGTHVAGTIGAAGGNGIGVAGVVWDVTMIAGKFLQGSGSTSNAIRAIDYAVDLKQRHGLNIVASSNSWGGGGFSQALLDAIERGGDAGILFVAAAGNDNSNIDGGAFYPAGYACTETATGQPRGWDCIVSVASITSTGARSSFSNYGAVGVDLGAPGSDIRSTLPGGTYGNYSGTSMATPHVSGAVALCAAIDPTLTAAGLRTALLGSVAPTTSLASITATGGRLDVGSLAAQCVGPSGPVSGGPTGLAATATATDTVRLTWTDGSTNATYHEVQRGAANCSGLVTVATVGSAATSAIVGGLAASTSYCFRVRSANAYAGGSTSAWSGTATATTLAPPPPYVCTPSAYAWIDATAGGTQRSLSDDASVGVSLGFTFPFYGTDHTAVRVNSNGYLVLGSDTGSVYTNAAIPNAAAPNALVAAFWDDLNPGVGGSVWTRTLGTAGARQFVASWNDVPVYGLTGSTLSFQVVLDEATGVVSLRYRDVIAGSAANDRGASATVGVESHDGRYGTQVSHNAATLSDLTAYDCSNGGTPPTPKVAAVDGIDVRVSTNKRGTTATAAVRVVDDVTAAPLGGTVVAGTWTSGGTSASASGTTASDGTVTLTSPRFPVLANGSVVTLCVTGLTLAEHEASGLPACGSRTVSAPLAVTTSGLPTGTVDVDYAVTLTSSGGAGAVTWSLAPGSAPLPTGLSLSAGGVLSGRVATPVSTSITVRAADAGSPPLTADRTFTLSFVDPSVLPVVVATPTVTTSTNKRGTVGTAAVSVTTLAGAPAASVVVTGTWTVDGTALTASASGTTGTGGTVSIASPRWSIPAGSMMRFCVTSVTVGGATYSLTTPVCGERRT